MNGMEQYLAGNELAKQVITLPVQRLQGPELKRVVSSMRELTLYLKEAKTTMLSVEPIRAAIAHCRAILDVSSTPGK